MATIGDTLRESARALAAIGSEEASLEAELLLAHVLDTDRTHLYQRLPEPLTDDTLQRFQSLLDRRLAHEPTAYILGHREFYGLELEVTPATIIPRQETETLVEMALEAARAMDEPLIVDVGTGCGAIAVALAVNLPAIALTAIDISPEALALARRNAERHGVAGRIRTLEGDLLDPLEGQPDIIVANLPYVLTGDFEAGPPEIREHEPRLGLDGGPDGLRVIARLLEGAPAKLRPGGTLLAEIGETQGEAAEALARAAFPDAAIEIAKDLSGLDRVLCVRSS